MAIALPPNTSFITQLPADGEPVGGGSGGTGGGGPVKPITPIDEPVNTGRWWNATKGIRVAVLPEQGEIICPPGEFTFYEAGDPKGEICLRLHGSTGGSTGGSTANITVKHLPPRDPSGTFRATNISQMYSFVPEITASWSYDVGKSPVITPILCAFRNDTVSHTLRVEIISLPNFVNTDLPTTQINLPVPIIKQGFEVPPLGIVAFLVSFNEAGAKELSTQKDRFINGELIFDVRPLNVIGQVFVKTDLPSLDLSIATPMQSGSTELWFNATKNIFVSTLPSGSIICPPHVKRFYEPDDPASYICLQKFALSDVLPYVPRPLPG